MSQVAWLQSGMLTPASLTQIPARGIPPSPARGHSRQETSWWPRWQVPCSRERPPAALSWNKTRQDLPGLHFLMCKMGGEGSPLLGWKGTGEEWVWKYLSD